jgi:hypothetical protein
VCAEALLENGMEILASAFQSVSAVASIGRVATRNNYFVSRCCNAVALGTVAADFYVKYGHDHSGDQLSGLATFATLTARTLLILALNFDDKNPRHMRWQKGIAAGAFGLCAVISMGGQLYLKGWIEPITILPLGGVALGCWGEASNNMVLRRRRTFMMGAVMTAFGLSTHAWGLVAKNVVSDVGATLFFASKYNDPPIPRMYSFIRPRLSGWLHF